VKKAKEFKKVRMKIIKRMTFKDKYPKAPKLISCQANSLKANQVKKSIINQTKKAISNQPKNPLN